jgi:hypothetical protein
MARCDPILLQQSRPLALGEQYCTGCPVSTEQGEEISEDGYDPGVFAYLVHGSPHPVERSQRQVRTSRLPVVAGSVAGAVSEVAACCGAGCGGGSRFCAWRFQSPASACLDACCTTHVNSVFLHPGRWGCPLPFAGGCLPFPSPVGRLKSPALYRGPRALGKRLGGLGSGSG